MTCACGMDSVGTCLVCGARLCPEHALRGSNRDVDALLHHVVRDFGVSRQDLYYGTFAISLDVVRSDLRPLFRFRAQRQAFVNTLGASGVICWDCRLNSACEAAGATQPTAPTLGAGGSQRLRDAVVAYLSGDMVAWGSMASDAASKDALFQDLIHLARAKAERLHAPVEWEVKVHKRPAQWPELSKGKVRVTEEVFHVVDVTVYEMSYMAEMDVPISYAQCMNRYGQWGRFREYGQEGVLVYADQPKLVTVKKAGWFSDEERVFRVSWSDEPPKTGLDNVLKRAAELLAPAS